MALSTCRKCKRITFTNVNGLCSGCALTAGPGENPSTRTQRCSYCGKIKSNVNFDGLCADCVDYKKRHPW